MANDLIVFKHLGHDVRVVGDDPDNPWFVARDVCEVLGLGNTTEALRGLLRDELSSEILNSGGQQREMTTISEPGLYRLVFRSNKDSAEAFRQFVFREVLPAIRKTGQYVAPASPAPTQRMVDIGFALDYVKKTCHEVGVDSDIAADMSMRVMATESGLPEDSFHGFMPLRPQSEYRHIATTIAPFIGAKNAQQANIMLANAGLQEKIGGVWYPMAKGKEYAQCRMWGYLGGASGHQIFWSERVAELFPQD